MGLERTGRTERGKRRGRGKEGMKEGKAAVSRKVGGNLRGKGGRL